MTTTPPTGPAAPASSRPLVLLLVADLVLAAWAATSYLAHRLAYEPNLGAWLFAVPGASARWWRAGAVLLVGAGVCLCLVMWNRRSPVRRWAPAVALWSAVTAAALWAAIETREAMFEF